MPTTKLVHLKTETSVRRYALKSFTLMRYRLFMEVIPRKSSALGNGCLNWEDNCVLHAVTALPALADAYTLLAELRALPTFSISPIIYVTL